MELELQRTCLNGFQIVLDRTVAQEETLESVVPDTCPDISRIVDVDGQVFLTSRELSTGSLRVTGAVRASVLYIPDGADEPQHMDVQLPFFCTVDDPSINSGCKVHVIPRMAGADGRAVNPRKILTRVELMIDIRIYAPDESNACIGLSCAGQENNGIQQKLVEQETYLISAVQEKIFTFSDVIDLPASRPKVKKLLRSKIRPRNLEAKVIGSKLVVKGEIDLELLYWMEDGQIGANHTQLPYSQIIELGGVEEDSHAMIDCAVSGMDCSLQLGDPGSVAITLEILVQASVWEKRRITLLTDLYSTQCPLEVERVDFKTDHLQVRETRRESMRQFCECGIPVKTVVDSFLSVSRVTTIRGEGTIQFRSENNITILFLSEDNALCSVTYPIPVGCEIALRVTDPGVLCRCSDAGTLMAVPVTGGLEVRFELDFVLLITESVYSPCVNSLRELPTEESDLPRPSLMVRRVEENEDFWDIAKSCNSTIDDIVAANELEERSAPAGMMLLIPRCR